MLRSEASGAASDGLSRSGRSALLAALLALLWSAPASAAPIPLVLEQAPDVVSGFLDVTFDSASDALAISGFALELDDDGEGLAIGIDDGTFDLAASVDDAGVLSSGSLTIGGTIGALGFQSGTLLTGTLTALGFLESGGDPLELVFDVTGGDLASLYGSGPAGIIVGGSGFTGSFAADFDNLLSGMTGTGSGVANTAPVAVPEPGALALLGLSLGVGVLARRSARVPAR